MHDSSETFSDPSPVLSGSNGTLEQCRLVRLELYAACPDGDAFFRSRLDYLALCEFFRQIILHRLTGAIQHDEVSIIPCVGENSIVVRRQEYEGSIYLCFVNIFPRAYTVTGYTRESSCSFLICRHCFQKLSTEDGSFCCCSTLHSL